MLRLATVVIVFVLAAMPVGANHCTSYSTSRSDLDVDLIADHYYVVVDCAMIVSPCPGPGPSGPVLMWVYEESNNITGLQRDDGLTGDTCHDLIEADTIVV